MRDLTNAMSSLAEHAGQFHRRAIFSYGEFLQEVIKHPEQSVRNVYQVYADMINTYIRDGNDDYADD